VITAERVKQLGAYRDAVLVSVSLVYLLGYLSWAFYAGTYGLGMVPVLDAQYLVAGLVPTLIVVVAIMLVALQWRFAKWASREPSDRRFKIGSYLSALAAVGTAGAGFAGWLFGKLDNPDAARVSLAIATLAAYGLMAGSLLQGSRGPKFFRLYGLGVLWVVIAFVPIIMILFYLERVFPKLPASLGGPAPQCVVMDVAAADLSASALALLSRQDTVPDTAPVVRTREVDLLFSTSEVVIFRLPGAARNEPVYSLAKRSIIGMATCPRRARALSESPATQPLR
jgi:hypothetical protein